MAQVRGRPFLPGNNANPSGRAKLEPHLRKFKAKKYEDFIESLEKMGDMSQDDLKAIVFNGKSKNMPIIFGRFILECQRGNMHAMKLLFEYLWGKPKEMDLNAIDVTAASRPLANATPEQLKNIMEGKVLSL